MSIPTRSEPASALRAERGAPRALLAGRIGLVALALLCGALGGALGSSPAEAAPKLCGDRHQILERPEQAHEETPQALGLSGDGGVVARGRLDHAGHLSPAPDLRRGNRRGLADAAAHRPARLRHAEAHTAGSVWVRRWLSKHERGHR